MSRPLMTFLIASLLCSCASLGQISENTVNEPHPSPFSHYMDDIGYVSQQQALSHVSLAASGDRQAAKRLSSYFSRVAESIRLNSATEDNRALHIVKELGGMLHWERTFTKFAEGDDSVLPEIMELDENITQGELPFPFKKYSSFSEEFMDKRFFRHMQ